MGKIVTVYPIRYRDDNSTRNIVKSKKEAMAKIKGQKKRFNVYKSVRMQRKNKGAKVLSEKMIYPVRKSR